jgi:hypothetical protein
MSESFEDFEFVLPEATAHHVIESIRPRRRLGLVPMTPDNPLLMEAGFRHFLESQRQEETAPDEIRMQQLRDSARAIASSAIVGWEVERDGQWVALEYTPRKGRDFLVKLIEAPQVGLGLFIAIEQEVVKMARPGPDDVTPADVESAAGNSSSG